VFAAVEGVWFGLVAVCLAPAARACLRKVRLNVAIFEAGSPNRGEDV